MAKPVGVVETGRFEGESPGGAHPLKRFGPSAVWVDERLGVASVGRKYLRKVFPDHWSFLLGEIALFSFIILLLTGVFLTLWFKPSMAEIEYDGSYQLLRGLQMSEAFASTLDISFDIRGGLLIRQMHHWAAHLFIAAMFVHMLRTFFTGAFRKPREINWLLGVGLLSMGMVEGFAGYSLPDDLLSGTGLRFADGMIRSVPIVGTWAEFFVFGGEYPGELIIARLYMVHILLLPGVLLGLIAAHIGLVVYHKHTQFPGPGRTERNVVGYPIYPVYMAKQAGFFFLVAGVITLMGGFFQINPVWTIGPYNPAQVTAGSQPDWYMGPAEGAVRIMPGWETHVLGTTWSWNIFIPGLGLLGLLFTSMALWPFFEQWITQDKREHHLLDYPWQNPTRTAFGVAAITCYILFLIAGGNDIIAVRFHVSLNAVTYFMRVAVFVLPVIAFIITKRLCLGIQRSRQERLLHGSESGLMERSAHGAYFEDHVPISTDEAYALTTRSDIVALPPRPDHDPASERATTRAATLRTRLHHWFFRDNIPKPTRTELDQAHSHDHQDTPELTDQKH